MHIQTEKTKVFISSSMREENGFDWMGLRSTIQDCLLGGSRPQFFVNEIENGASPISSREYYLSLVEQSDIIVCIVGNDLRPGTAEEVGRTLELGKPLLLYFLSPPAIAYSDGKESAGVAALRKQVQAADSCTYKTVNDAGQLPQMILCDLQTALTQSLRRIGKRQDDSIPVKDVNALGLADAPDTVLAPFGNVGHYLQHRIGLSSGWEHAGGGDSYLEDLGVGLVDWMLDGKRIDLDSYEKTIRLATESLEEQEALSLRRGACNCALRGDYAGAVRQCEAAVSAVADNNDWIRGTALIDLRNYYQLEDDFEHVGEAQGLIDQVPLSATFPVGNHYLLKAHKLVDDIGEFGREQHEGSFSSNSKIYEVLDNCLNYLLVSALFGAFAHMRSARHELGRALVRLAPVYDMPTLGYWGMRLLLLSGSSREVRACFDRDWNLIGNIVSAHADELWEAVSATGVLGADSMKSLAVELLSSYVCDDAFDGMVEDVLVGQPGEWDPARLKALESASMRMEPGQLVNCLVDILHSRCALSEPFVVALTNVSPSKLSDEQARLFTDAIIASAKDIAGNSRVSELIAALAHEDARFMYAAQALRGLLDEGDLAHFDYQLGGRKDCGLVIRALLADAEGQIEDSQSAGVVFTFGSRPFASLARLIEDEENAIQTDSLDQIVNVTTRALATVKSNGSLLDDALRLAISLAVSYVEGGADINERLVACATKLSEERADIRADMFFRSVSKSSWLVGVLSLKAICGLIGLGDIANRYLTLASRDYAARKAMSDVLPYLVRSEKSMNSDGLTEALCVLYDLMTDSNEGVRKQSALSAAVFCGTELEAAAMHVLEHLSLDPKQEVRYGVIQACRDYLPEDNVWRRSLLESLASDANFHIRRHAERALQGNDPDSAKATEPSGD